MAADERGVPVLTLDAARVFHDGFLGDLRLDHPEGVAVDPTDGSVWCGGEAGQIYRIDPGGASMELRAQHAGGLTLSVAFGPDGLLYHVDLGNRAVHRLDTETGAVETFVSESIGGHALRLPNAIAFDGAGRMYLTDSYASGEPGPGIYRVDPDGSGGLWYGGPLHFANGVVVAPDGSAVYVAESRRHAVSRVPLRADGSAGEPETYVELGESVVPDGLCFGPDGLLYVACYMPHQIMRVEGPGHAVVLIRDDEGRVLGFPTNLAFRGSTLFAANLGRWHVTAIETGGDEQTDGR